MLDPGSWDQMWREGGEGLLKRFHHVSATMQQPATSKHIKIDWTMCCIFFSALS